MSNIKSDLEGLTDSLNNLEWNLEGTINNLKEREEKWKKLDDEALNIRKNNNIVKLNVSGE